MKTTQRRIISIAVIILALFAIGAVIHAQTDDQTTTYSTLQPINPADAPDGGAYFLMSDYINNGGSLGGPFPYLKYTNAPLFSLNGTSFLVDDAAITNDDELANALSLLAQPQDQFSARLMGGRAMTMDSIDLGDDDGGTNSGGSDGVFFSSVTYSSNVFWIEVPTNSLATTNEFAVILHDTEEDQPYDLFTSTNLSLPLEQWTLEQSLLGAEGTNLTPAQLLMNGRTNLFVTARFGGSSDGSGLPDWWELKYFGTNGIDPYAQDSSGDGWNNQQDFQNGFVPGTFNTPPAPQGVTVHFNTSSGAVSVNWQTSPGAVQSYTVEKHDYVTPAVSDSSISAGTTTYSDTVTPTPSDPIDYAFNYGPTTYVTYNVKAHYTSGDSGWSGPVQVEPNELAADAFGEPADSVQLITGPEGSANLNITSLLPTDIKALLITRIDIQELFWGGASYSSNWDISISAFTNGVYPFPQAETSPTADDYGPAQYVWWVQGVHSDNTESAAAVIGQDEISGNSPAGVGPFFDAREQLKQNIDFLLRVANNDSPFGYSPADSLTVPTHNYPYTYVCSGLYQVDACGASPVFDLFEPYEENSFYFNFIFSETNVDSEGKLPLITDDYALLPGCNGGFTFGPIVEGPLPSQFQYPTTSPPFPALLDSPWTYFLPLDTSDGLSLVNITSAGGMYYMTNNTVNFYGLPYVAAEFASAGLNFVTLTPDHPVAAMDGYAYAQTAAPDLKTMDYYFARPGLDPIPGDYDFSVTNATAPLLIAGFGQTFQIAGYARQQLQNGYTNVYACLGQYFDYVIATNADGQMTTNQAGFISPYGAFVPTMPGPAALVTMTNFGETNGIRGTAVVQVVKLQLDVNRDGNMDLSFGGPDNTSQAQPFEFWVNNDYDAKDYDADPGYDVDNPLDGDFDIDEVHSQRDLEDFARLWICGVPALTNGNFQVTLSWNVISGTPAIQLVNSVETNGGTGYLTDTNISLTQATTYYDSSSATRYGPGFKFAAVLPSQPYTFTNTFFADGANKYLLFDGCGIGKGELVMTISQNGRIIAQTSTWLDLHDIKDFYEQAVLTDNMSGAISNWTSAIETVLPAKYALGNDTNLIVLVHGINVQPWDCLNDAETVRKRLYWAGYQGSFAEVKWPCNLLTPIPSPFSPADFNESELQGYKASTAFITYLTQLRARFPGFRLHLLVHSQGNALVSEALAQSQFPVDTYILTQAAISDGAYDVNATDDIDLMEQDLVNHTPDWQPWGYRGVYTNLTVRMVNFHNPQDGVVQIWISDQELLKPSVFFSTAYYSYNGTNSHYYPFVGPGYIVTDPEESRGMVARSRSLALGLSGPESPSGVIQLDVDLNAKFNFNTAIAEHSAQWTRPIQTSLPYYVQVLKSISP